MGPRRYRIVVVGELSRRFAPAFEGMTVRCTGGQTAITGMVVDQSQLHGLLDRVGELGLELLSVNAVGDENSPDGESTRRRAGNHPVRVMRAFPAAPTIGQSGARRDGVRESCNVGAANYEIRVKGRVSDSLLSAFEGLAVTTEPVETVVYGPLADQEAVHQLLIKLESLGLEVVEFRRLPGEAGDPGVPPPSP